MFDKIIKGIGAAAGAVIGFFGGWTPLLTILVVAMTTDYISGIIVAVSNKSPKTENGGLSSKVGFIGIAKKGFILLIVLIATLLDKAAGNQTMVFQSATTLYYIANEGLSVLENAAILGVPVPQLLRKGLEEINEDDKKE